MSPAVRLFSYEILSWRTPLNHPLPEQFLPLWLVHKERIWDNHDNEGPAVGEYESQDEGVELLVHSFSAVVHE